MKNKLQVTEYWKNAVEELRKDIVQYGGCRLKYDLERNEYGDPVKMVDFQAVMKAKTVTSDFILTVDVDAEPESTRLDGLCVATFEGLAQDSEGEAYAVFKNGRCLPFLRLDTPLIEDPAERMARELTHARLSRKRSEKPTAKSAPLPNFSFKRKGDFWEIIYEGNTLAPVRHLKGMTYIAALIKAKGETISAGELYRIENPPTGEVLDRSCNEKKAIEERYGNSGAVQKIHTRKSKSKIEEAIAEMKALIKSETDPDRLQKLEADKEGLENSYREATLATGTGIENGASFESPEIRKPRQAVSKALFTAIDAIKITTGNRALVRHLKNAFDRMGANPKYSGGQDWET